MKSLRIIFLALAVSACATAPTKSTQDVRAQVERLMGDFVAMQLESVKAGLTEDVVAYELDLDGKPVRLGSRDDVVRYAEDLFAQVQKMGAILKLDIRANDCRVNASLAYCTVEYDFKAMMADGGAMVQPSRTTFLLHKGGDGWKVTHWHTSLSE